MHLYQDDLSRIITVGRVVEENGCTGIRAFQRTDTEIFVDTADGEYLRAVAMFGNHDTFVERTSRPAGRFLHQVDKLTADHYLIVIRFARLEGFALNDGYFHDLEIIVGDEIHIGNIEQLTVFTRQGNIISGGIIERQFGTASDLIDLWQAAQFVDSTLTFLCSHSSGIAIDQVFVGIPRIARDHLVILAADRDQKRYQISRGDKLHEKQAQFPIPLRLLHAAESRCNRYAQEKPGRDKACHPEYNQADTRQKRHGGQRKQSRQGCRQQIFHLTSENKDQESTQQQGKQEMQERFGKYHSENIFSGGSVAFMYRHLFCPSDQGGDNYENIVQHGDDDQDRSQKKQHRIHIFYIFVVVMDILQGGYSIKQIDTGFLETFQILVAFLHAADRGGERLGSCSRK